MILTGKKYFYLRKIKNGGPIFSKKSKEQQQLAAEEEREVTTRDFSVYGRPLEMVTSFRYLEWVILVADNDWTEVVKNLARARKVWSRMLYILSRERAAQGVSRFFFKAVVQAVLLFGADTWVVNPACARTWWGFRPRW